MAGKKSDLDALLSNESAPPPIQRGQGMRLSTAAPTTPATRTNENAAPPRRVKRVNRGYMLREDLIKACKQLALDEDRNLYEVMEDALEQYVARHQARA